VSGRPRVIWVLPLQGQEAVGGGDQRGVVMPAQPGAAFVVVKAEVSFELAVVQLDLPPQPGEHGDVLVGGVGGEVADPVVGRLVVPVGPFDDQPLLARRADLGGDLVRGADAEKDELGCDRLAVGPVTESERLCGALPLAGDQCLDQLGLAVGPGRVGGRPLALVRSGTANTVSGAYTAVCAPTASTYGRSAWCRRSRSAVLSP